MRLFTIKKWIARITFIIAWIAITSSVAILFTPQL